MFQNVVATAAAEHACPAWLEEPPHRAAGACTGARLVKETRSRLLHVRRQAGHAGAHIVAGREQFAAPMQTRPT